MKHRIALVTGILLIAGGLLGASFTLVSPGTSAENHEQRSPTHEQMHEMMDGMMGEGFTERMHAAMPGSADEKVMETCTTGMQGMMSGDGMDNMMDGMMDGMGE